MIKLLLPVSRKAWVTIDCSELLVRILTATIGRELRVWVGTPTSLLCTAMWDKAESAGESIWLVAEEERVHLSGGCKSVVWEPSQSGLLQGDFLEQFFAKSPGSRQVRHSLLSLTNLIRSS